ncbi:MAG: ABC transporter ATP-binding protein [Planctomycetes bacterium]|nr:ABC transporter ATP-binding protein [Planctomycetota bacterium]NUQ33479.1 ABC transporter ATP-binding protein [Planctomycetaceae bacterium]
MIEAKGLSKFYGDFIAVRDMTFTVPKGRVTAFLGPNGAGKTTTMKLLSGYLAPSQGSASICGHDPIKDRIAASMKLGFLPENGPLYLEMTPREMLVFLGRARGLDANRLEERLNYVVEHCSLREIYDKPIHKLSKGNRQRVGMAQALLHEPEALILDEPTSGLDPNQILAVRKLIREFGKTGAVLLSTHILQEVEAIADHVIFVHEGRMVFDGTVQELKGKDRDLDRVFASLTGAAEERAAAGV